MLIRGRGQYLNDVLHVNICDEFRPQKDFLKRKRETETAV